MDNSGSAKEDKNNILDGPKEPEEGSAFAKRSYYTILTALADQDLVGLTFAEITEQVRYSEDIVRVCLLSLLERGLVTTSNGEWNIVSDDEISARMLQRSTVEVSGGDRYVDDNLNSLPDIGKE